MLARPFDRTSCTRCAAGRSSVASTVPISTAGVPRMGEMRHLYGFERVGLDTDLLVKIRREFRQQVGSIPFRPWSGKAHQWPPLTQRGSIWQHRSRPADDVGGKGPAPGRL
jgi:hypothetical protein